MSASLPPSPPESPSVFNWSLPVRSPLSRPRSPCGRSSHSTFRSTSTDSLSTLLNQLVSWNRLAPVRSLSPHSFDSRSSSMDRDRLPSRPRRSQQPSCLSSLLGRGRWIGGRILHYSNFHHVVRKRSRQGRRRIPRFGDPKDRSPPRPSKTSSHTSYSHRQRKTYPQLGSQDAFRRCSRSCQEEVVGSKSRADQGSCRFQTLRRSSLDRSFPHLHRSWIRVHHHHHYHFSTPILPPRSTS